MDARLMKMEKRVPYRIHSKDGFVFLWIDPNYSDVVKDVMPGVAKANETDRSVEEFVHTREFDIMLDPLAETPDAAIQALTAYLNEAIGLTSPASAQAELLADGDTNAPQPIPQEI